MNHLLIFNIGGSEFILIILVVLLFFGAKGVPDMAKSLGRATREFKDAMNGIERELRDASRENRPSDSGSLGKASDGGIDEKPEEKVGK